MRGCVGKNTRGEGWKKERKERTKTDGAVGPAYTNTLFG